MELGERIDGGRGFSSLGVFKLKIKNKMYAWKQLDEETAHYELKIGKKINKITPFSVKCYKVLKIEERYGLLMELVDEGRFPKYPSITETSSLMLALLALQNKKIYPGDFGVNNIGIKVAVKDCKIGKLKLKKGDKYSLLLDFNHYGKDKEFMIGEIYDLIEDLCKDV